MAGMGHEDPFPGQNSVAVVGFESGPLLPGCSLRGNRRSQGAPEGCNFLLDISECRLKRGAQLVFEIFPTGKETDDQSDETGC
jgi:hypothetical protein